MNCAISSAVASQLTARYPWPELLGDPRARPCAPRGSGRPARRRRRSATTLTSPSVSPTIRARLLPPYGSFFTTTSMPASLACGLGQPGEGHLGVAVDGPRHPGVVDGERRLPQDCLDDEDPLGEPDVGQLGRVDHVTDRPHAVGRRALVLVDDDVAPFVEA